MFRRLRKWWNQNSNPDVHAQALAFGYNVDFDQAKAAVDFARMSHGEPIYVMARDAMRYRISFTGDHLDISPYRQPSISDAEMDRQDQMIVPDLSHVDHRPVIFFSPEYDDDGNQLFPMGLDPEVEAGIKPPPTEGNDSVGLFQQVPASRWVRPPFSDPEQPHAIWTASDMPSVVPHLNAEDRAMIDAVAARYVPEPESTNAGFNFMAPPSADDIMRNIRNVRILQDDLMRTGNAYFLAFNVPVIDFASPAKDVEETVGEYMVRTGQITADQLQDANENAAEGERVAAEQERDRSWGWSATGDVMESNTTSFEAWMQREREKENDAWIDDTLRLFGVPKDDEPEEQSWDDLVSDSYNRNVPGYVPSRHKARANYLKRKHKVDAVLDTYDEMEDPKYAGMTVLVQHDPVASKNGVYEVPQMSAVVRDKETGARMPGLEAVINTHRNYAEGFSISKADLEEPERPNLMVQIAAEQARARLHMMKNPSLVMNTDSQWEALRIGRNLYAETQGEKMKAELDAMVEKRRETNPEDFETVNASIVRRNREARMTTLPFANPYEQHTNLDKQQVLNNQGRCARWLPFVTHYVGTVDQFMRHPVDGYVLITESASIFTSKVHDEWIEVQYFDGEKNAWHRTDNRNLTRDEVETMTGDEFLAKADWYPRDYNRHPFMPDYAPDHRLGPDGKWYVPDAKLNDPDAPTTARDDIKRNEVGEYIERTGEDEPEGTEDKHEPPRLTDEEVIEGIQGTERKTPTQKPAQRDKETSPTTPAEGTPGLTSPRRPTPFSYERFGIVPAARASGQSGRHSDKVLPDQGRVEISVDPKGRQHYLRRY